MMGSCKPPLTVKVMSCTKALYDSLASASDFLDAVADASPLTAMMRRPDMRNFQKLDLNSTPPPSNMFIYFCQQKIFSQPAL